MHTFLNKIYALDRFSQVPLLRCQGLIYYKRESENMKMNFAVLNDLPHNNAIIKFKVGLCIDL